MATKTTKTKNELVEVTESRRVIRETGEKRRVVHVKLTDKGRESIAERSKKSTTSRSTSKPATD